MISDQDITKLKTVFATKEDLKKLSKTFATKKEFQALKYEVGDLRVEVGEVKDSVQGLHIKLDNFLGRIDDLDTDNAVGTVIQYRHERHIQALADHVGLTLPEE